MLYVQLKISESTTYSLEVRKPQQMLHYDYFKLYAHSMKLWIENKNNTNRRPFFVLCEELEVTIERSDQFNRLLPRYIDKVFEDPSRDASDHVNKNLCALKFYIFETKDLSHLSLGAMVGWTGLKRSWQKTLYTHEPTLRTTYYFQRVG